MSGVAVAVIYCPGVQKFTFRGGLAGGSGRTSDLRFTMKVSGRLGACWIAGGGYVGYQRKLKLGSFWVCIWNYSCMIAIPSYRDLFGHF